MKITLICALAFVIAGCAKKDPSLVGWWNFDKVSGDFISDLSGNGLDAKMVNATFSDGKTGKAFYGDGKGYLEVSHSPILDSFEKGITIAAWIYREVDSTRTYNCVVTRETGISWSEYFDIAVHENKPLFAVDIDGQNYEQTKYEGTLPLNQWIHLAGTFDTKTYRLFINGNEVASGIKEGIYQFTDKNPLIIGSNTNDGGQVFHDFFYGMIDDLRIYNRPLSAGEIHELAN